MKFDVLREYQIPVLLGLDPKESAWTLWHQCKGDYTLIPSHESLAERMHGSLIQWVVENSESIFAVPARFPKGVAQKNPSIPIATLPDMVIPKHHAYGKGFGIVLVSHISSREWRTFWHPGSFSPKPPANVNAKMQASMIASQAQWGLVLPIIGIDTPKAPLLVEPDEDLQREISQTSRNFFDSVQKNQPPTPDHKANQVIMRLLARLSASRKNTDPEIKPISDEDFQELQQQLEKYEDLKNKYSQFNEDNRNLSSEIKKLEAILMVASAKHGTLNLNGTKIIVRSEEREPRVMEQKTVIVLERENPVDPPAAHPAN